MLTCPFPLEPLLRKKNTCSCGLPHNTEMPQAATIFLRGKSLQQRAVICDICDHLCHLCFRSLTNRNSHPHCLILSGMKPRPKADDSTLQTSCSSSGDGNRWVRAAGSSTSTDPSCSRSRRGGAAHPDGARARLNGGPTHRNAGRRSRGCIHRFGDERNRRHCRR